MITAKNVAMMEKDPLELYGLSTDTKPTETFNGMPLENGSFFYEMNTGKAYMYDAANVTWIEQ